MLTTTIDTSGVDFVLNGVKNALIGSGGDVSELAKDETRLLAMQLMKLSQPEDRNKTKANIDKSVRSRFDAFAQDTGEEGHGLGISRTGVQWYAADRRFLFGLDPAGRDMRKADANQLVSVYYTSKFSGGKARQVSEFHFPRKQQRVAIRKTILTSQSGLKRVVKAVQGAIGKWAASWYATAVKIDPGARAPKWIADHIGHETKSITDLSGLRNLENPSATFGSRARGAATPIGKRKVQFAIRIREQKLAARLKLILSGYSKDVAAGIRVQRHANKVKGVE